MGLQWVPFFDVKKEIRAYVRCPPADHTIPQGEFIYEATVD